jgi:hypothetical protein
MVASAAHARMVSPSQCRQQISAVTPDGATRIVSLHDRFHELPTPFHRCREQHIQVLTWRSARSAVDTTSRRGSFGSNRSRCGDSAAAGSLAVSVPLASVHRLPSQYRCWKRWEGSDNHPGPACPGVPVMVLTGRRCSSHYLRLPNLLLNLVDLHRASYVHLRDVKELLVPNLDLDGASRLLLLDEQKQ